MGAASKTAATLPNSRYARELQSGGGSMQFSPAIEAQYRTFFLAERRSHVRSFNFILGASALGTSIASMAVPGWRIDGLEPLRLFGLAVAYLFLAVLAYSRWYERVYLKAAYVACLLISLIGSIEIGCRIAAGQGELFALLTAFSFGLYFLAGLLYRSALRINAVLVVCFATTLALLAQPLLKILYLTAILASVSAIVALAFRHQGIRFRRSFLERCLIAEMAERDGLTGLKNRRAFDEHLERAWKQALRDRRLLVLLLVDIDHFKALNDCYGHQAGDAALIQIAAIVNEVSARPLDMAARYGGEELAVICYDLNPSHALKVAEQIRAGVENLAIEHRASPPLGVATVSVGVAVATPTTKRSPQGLVQLADEALYKAKNRGRNCVVVHESEYDTLVTGQFQVKWKSAAHEIAGDSAK